MKKQIISILATVFAVILCACGTGARDTSNAETQSNVATSKPKEQNTGDPSDAAADVSVENDSIGETVSSTDDIWFGDKMFTLGTVKNGCYESTFLGYGFKRDNWAITDEEQIAALNHWSKDAFSAELKEMIKQSGNIVELMATSNEGSENLNIQYQINDLYKEASIESLLDLMLPTMAETFENAGYQNTTIEKTTAVLAGDVHPAALIIAKYNGILLYQKQVYIQHGECLAFITATSFSENTVDGILESFYKLGE